MRIDVVGRNVAITDAIRGHAESKAAKLTRFFDGVQQITVNISRQNHQHTGPFDVELVVDVVKHDDFVSHASDPDLYAAIDLVVDKGVRQLSEFKERLRTDNR